MNGWEDEIRLARFKHYYRYTPSKVLSHSIPIWQGKSPLKFMELEVII